MNLLDNNGLEKNNHSRPLSPSVFKRRRLFRVITTLTGAAVGAVSTLAYGLGLGEIQSTSFIGQQLKANIELVSVGGDIDINSLIIRRVTAEEAQKLGVDIIYNGNKFDFKLVTNTGIPFVSVESRDPVNEPYLNLLVELRWPNGVVYREYPVLLDPPPKAPVIAAKNDSIKAKEQPVLTPRPVLEQRASPKPSKAPTVASTRRLPVEPLAAADGKYRVKSGDTLSKIAERWREGTDRGIYDTMEWLHQNNLHAFTNQNIDLLRAGAVLQMPDLSAYAVNNKVPSKEETAKAVQVKEPSEGVVKPSKADEFEQKSQKIVRDVNAISGDAASRGLLTVSTANQDDNTRELIDMLVRENESLRARMEKVESSEYLDTLKQLIILQRQQISDLRSRIGVSDSGGAKEIDELLERIGIAEKGLKPDRQFEAVLNDPELTVDQQSDQAKIELASENVAAKKEKDENLAPVKVDPVLAAPVLTNKTERDWLIWLVIGGAAAILAAFSAMFIYYRKVLAREDAIVDDVADDDEDDLFGPLDEPAMGSDAQSVDKVVTQRLAALDHGNVKVHSTPFIADHEDPKIEFDGDVSSYQPKKVSDDAWLGDSAAITESDVLDMDAAMREVQAAFDDLLLDESALEEIDNESTLEALTAEIPKSKKKGKTPKIERRTDDEVKMSIAEKMAQYNPEEYRQEIENLGFLELDELADFEEEQDEIDTTVYRAMMFCEFKKFSKARDLLAAKMQDGDDGRLASALEQVDAMESDLKNNSKAAG